VADWTAEYEGDPARVQLSATSGGVGPQLNGAQEAARQLANAATGDYVLITASGRTTPEELPGDSVTVTCAVIAPPPEEEPE
jgi:hypothetical protein